jgi:hypothetical protein
MNKEKFAAQYKKDPRELPAYSIVEAARYLQIEGRATCRAECHC